MAAKEAHAEPELDEDGLEVQKYVSTVLVVVPAEGYDEQALRYARSSLLAVHVGTRSVATNTEELLKGRLQDEFMVDGPLEGEALQAYSGVLFVGGSGGASLAELPAAQRLAKEAAEAGKLVGAWGDAVAVLARAGVVRGKKVAGAPQLADEVRRAGGKYTSRQMAVDGTFVTGRDASSGMRFGKALAEVVGI